MNGEVDDRDNKKPEASQNETGAIGWLKLLAAKRDDIWGRSSETSEVDPNTATRTDPDSVADGQPAHDVHAPLAPVEGQLSGNEQAATDPAAVQDDQTQPEEKPVSESIDVDRAQDSESPPVSRLEEDALGLVNTVELDADELMWLDEMDTVPDMITNPWEDEDKEFVGAADESTGDDVEAGQEDGAFREADQADSDEVPEDPDEAIAWLERLAAKQGAPSEELPTVQQAGPGPEENGPTDEGFPADLDAGEIPEDPDEAMAWLERLAARQGASVDELPTVSATAEITEPTSVTELDFEDVDEPVEPALNEELDQALGWLEELAIERELTPEVVPDEAPDLVTEEPPTPAVAHDVDEAMAAADLLFAEPEELFEKETAEAVEEEQQPEDEEDAMAWLEQLAARQGAPIEELTTVDGEPEDEQDLEEPIQLVSEQSDEAEFEVVAAVDEVEAPETEAEFVGEALSADEVVEVESEDLASFDGAAPEMTGDVPAEDLAWLDTLGAVDAEAWLDTEAAVDEVEANLDSLEGVEVAATVASEAEVDEVDTLAGRLPGGPESEELELARRAIDEGAVEEGLSAYASLVEKGELMPFLIDDLEAVYESRGPEPALQRVLGDAYARNGQLQKALQAYREALDNL